MKDSESELTGDLDGILWDFNANRGNPIMALTAQCATHSKGQVLDLVDFVSKLIEQNRCWKMIILNA